jgi:hypothetical protein
MLAVVLLVLFQPGANDVSYCRIQTGMTRQQVADIVRQPPVSKVTDADRYSVWFTMSSFEIRKEGSLWRAGTRKLWVAFDKDQRVRAKMLEYDQVDLLDEAIRKATAAKKSQ